MNELDTLFYSRRTVNHVTTFDYVKHAHDDIIEIRQDGKLITAIPAVNMFDALRKHMDVDSDMESVARRARILHGTQPASSTLPRQ